MGGSGRRVSFEWERDMYVNSTGGTCLIHIPPVDGQQATRAPIGKIVDRLVGNGDMSQSTVRSARSNASGNWNFGKGLSGSSERIA